LPDADLAKFTGYDGKANLQKVKQLMTAAGFPDGFKGRMPVRQDFEPQGVAVQAMLKKAGFDFNIEVQKSAVFTQRALAADWDILTHIWAIPADDPDDSFAEMLISPDRAGRNWAQITIPEVDRLFDQQRLEFDVEKRKALVHDADKAALGAYPNMVLAYQPDLSARYLSIKDYKTHISPYTNQRFENVWLAR
jgi:peptide/nickel transport system substrate-binding protein